MLIRILLRKIENEKELLKIDEEIQMIMGEVDADYFSSRRKENLLMLEIKKEEKIETKGGNMETKAKGCVSSFCKSTKIN